MPQREPVLWTILGLMRGSVLTETTTDKDGRTTRLEHQDSYGFIQLKGELVLQFKPDDIEDTLYFMVHRGHLSTRGPVLSKQPLIYSLTDKGRATADSKKLPAEEADAFRESLWDMKPNFYGIGVNGPEWWRRLVQNWKIFRS